MTTVDDVDAGTATSRPMRKDAARNRELLLAAARDVFCERGLDASLDDIAARAGVGVGTAYRHFANKHELARAIIGGRIEEIVDLAESAAKEPEAWDGIVAFVEGAAVAQIADRGLREVLMGVTDPKQTEHVQERIASPLRGLVDRAKAAGELRDDAAATDLGVVMMMICTIADITADVAPDLWRRYLPMLLAGLRPGADLPVPPIDEASLNAAMGTYKQRLHGGPCR